MPSEVSEREQKVLNIIETARAKKQKFRDTQITMAHGAGGKATQGLIEGLLVPAFANETLEAMADAGTVVVLGGQVAMTTDSFVVNPIVFPGGTIGDLAVNGTVNDLAMAGARAARADAVADPRGGPAGGDAQAPGRRDRRGRGRRPACRSSPATRRSSRAACATRCTSARRGSACSTTARTCRPRRCGPATRSSCPAGSAITAPRSCSPAASSISTPTSRRTPNAFGRWSTSCWTKPVRRCAACATRPAAASHRSSTNSREHRV